MQPSQDLGCSCYSLRRARVGRVLAADIAGNSAMTLAKTIRAGIARSRESDSATGWDPDLVGEQRPQRTTEDDPERDPDDCRNGRDDRRLPGHHVSHFSFEKAERQKDGQIPASSAHRTDQCVAHHGDSQDGQNDNEDDGGGPHLVVAVDVGGQNPSGRQETRVARTSVLMTSRLRRDVVTAGSADLE